MVAMSSPISHALERVQRPADTRCAVGRWLPTITPDEHAQLLAACVPGQVHTVYKALHESGVTLPCRESTWYRHWDERCDCPGEAA